MATASAAENSARSVRQLAHSLGWFSIALGAVEILAPDALCQYLGLRGKERLIQAYGAREVLAGIGILSNSNPTAWLWSRVAGDALDLATLACADRRAWWNVERAMALVTAVTVVDIACATGLAANDTAQVARAKRYQQRAGLPRPLAAIRAKVRPVFIPDDMRTPKAMRYAERTYP